MSAPDFTHLLTIRAMGLGSEGQMTQAQWLQHCADTPGLEAAWEERSRGREEMPAIAAHVVNGPWRLGHGGTIVCTNAKIGGEAKLFDVRGWGYLTGGGHGALGLSQEDGAKVQDRMAAVAIAAPEMLEACRFALKTILDEAEARNYDPPANTELVAELEFAIAKATTSGGQS